jgi:hypothetical protein
MTEIDRKKRLGSDRPSLKNASTDILKLLSRFIGVNTFFVAENDGVNNHFVKVLNQDSVLVEEGGEVLLKEAY